MALSEQRLKQQRESLELAKRSLEIQLAQNEIDIKRYKALVEKVRAAEAEGRRWTPVGTSLDPDPTELGSF